MTSGCSPGRRCGPRGPTSPTSACCLARTDPDVPKRRGITYFLVDLHAAGVEVRPLRHIAGEVDFNEVFLDGCRVPDAHRVGVVGDGWRVANATLSGERQMVSGSGSGGVDRIGGAGADAGRARGARRAAGRRDDPVVRQRSCGSTRGAHPCVDQPARAGRPQGGPPAGSGELDRQGPPGRAQPAHPGARRRPARPGGATAWESDAADLRRVAAVRGQGMLRSRANTIEGGTTEVNKNIVGERVLGLPREPDPWQAPPWRDVPRELREPTLRDARRRAAGPGRLDRVRSARRRQRHGRHDVRRAGTGLARARRRSRRAGHREHRQRPGVPDRPRREQMARDPTRCASSRGGPAGRAQVHGMAPRHPKPVIAAVNGTCAGAGCTSWPTPTSSSPQPTPRSSTPTCRSARSSPTRHHPRPEVAHGGHPADGPGRAATSASAPSGPASSASSARSSTLPPTAGRGAGARRQDRPELPRRDGGHQARPVGRARGGADRRLPRRIAELVGMWGHPDQEEGPLAFTERRERTGHDRSTSGRDTARRHRRHRLRVATRRSSWGDGAAWGG